MRPNKDAKPVLSRLTAAHRRLIDLLAEVAVEDFVDEIHKGLQPMEEAHNDYAHDRLE